MITNDDDDDGDVDDDDDGDDDGYDDDENNHGDKVNELWKSQSHNASYQGVINYFHWGIKTDASQIQNPRSPLLYTCFLSAINYSAFIYPYQTPNRHHIIY